MVSNSLSITLICGGTPLYSQNPPQLKGIIMSGAVFDSVTQNHVEVTLLTALALLLRPGYSFLHPKRPAVMLLTECMEANHTTAIFLSVLFFPISLCFSVSIYLCFSVSLCVCFSVFLFLSTISVYA